jgi:hypothetical protein
VKDKDKAQLDVCRGDLMAFQLLHPTPCKSQRPFLCVVCVYKSKEVKAGNGQVIEATLLLPTFIGPHRSAVRALYLPP